MSSAAHSGEPRLLEEIIIAAAQARSVALATAESCTGGLIAHRLTNVPGSSAVFLQGWVAYSNGSKTRALGVPGALIERHGAVSGEVAAAMAAGALRESGADLALAVTGIAGPAGGTPEKPVGTVWFGLARARGGAPQSGCRHFSGGREAIKAQAADAALEWLLEALAA